MTKLNKTKIALQKLEQGLILAKEYPVEAAQLYQTRFLITAEPQDKEQALQIFKAIGAAPRVAKESKSN